MENLSLTDSGTCVVLNVRVKLVLRVSVVSKILIGVIETKEDWSLLSKSMSKSVA